MTKKLGFVDLVVDSYHGLSFLSFYFLIPLDVCPLSSSFLGSYIFFS
jgi:hypothetical protein